jgi:hypothetical protein
MEVIITEWAKQSYLNLRNAQVFTREEYKNTLRPDAELLKIYPHDLKFKVSNFWAPAVDVSNKSITNGFKMKWHNIGNGKVQLRLLVVIIDSEIDNKIEERSFLCESYVKTGSSQDKRQMEKLKIKIRRIAQGNFFYRGSL